MSDSLAPRSDYFIHLVETAQGSAHALVVGASTADSDMKWQMGGSADAKLAAPLRYLSNYIESETLPDLLENDGLLFVSERLRTALVPWLPAESEFVPAEVEYSNNKQTDELGGARRVGGYWWLNSWRLVDAIDWDASQLVWRDRSGDQGRHASSPVRAIGWKQLVLMPDAIEAEHFFGLAGIYGARRFLSPKLHAHLLDFGFRLHFKPEFLGPATISPYKLSTTLNRRR